MTETASENLAHPALQPASDSPPVSAQPAAAASAPRPRPLMTLRATSGWAALNFAELWHFRDLILTLAGRDIKVRYKQTLLGVIWVVLQPLLGAGVLSFVFGKVAKLNSDGIPYFLFSYVGMLAWNAFNNTLGKTSGSMLGNAHLISKVYFPRLVLPIATTFGTLIDFAVALAMMPILLAIYHIAPGWGLLLLPVWLALLLLLSMGIGLIAAALQVSYRDVGYVLPVATQFLFYLCPVAYALKEVPARLQNLYLLNPVAGLVAAFRWSLLNQGIVPWGFVGYAAGLSIALFLVGAIVFKRMERKFVDII
jgi:lipopolysaccharide transport system permease protein